MAALGYARSEARTWQCEYIGTEHLLLGLTGDSNCVAARVLQQQHPDAATMIRNEIKKLLQSPTGVPRATHGLLDDPPLTPRVMNAVRTATEFATDQLDWNGSRVGTEHILLALLSDDETVAYQLLANHGITYDASLDVTRGLVRPV